MGKVFTNILAFITDPKNTRMLLFAGMILFLMLFLHQCNARQNAEAEMKAEIQRVENNLAAAQDTIKNYQIDEDTWAAEKKGYTLTIDELKEDYADLMGDLEYEKNKPPKTVVATKYVVKDSIIEVPIYIVDGDTLSEFNKAIVFSDSAHYDTTNTNYRYLTGLIPFKYNFLDSTISPGLGTFDLEFGMNLNFSLLRDKKTKQVSIVATTNYPGVTFTQLNGAYIIDDPKNRKVVRQMRKQFAFGISAGYGLMFDTKANNFATGPYIGFGFNWQPKILQW